MVRSTFRRTCVFNRHPTQQIKQSLPIYKLADITELHENNGRVVRVNLEEKKVVKGIEGE